MYPKCLESLAVSNCMRVCILPIFMPDMCISRSAGSCFSIELSELEVKRLHKSQCRLSKLVICQQALEKSVEAGGALDQYEIEGPDRAELLQDLAEFQLAAVSTQNCPAACLTCLPSVLHRLASLSIE